MTNAPKVTIEKQGDLYWATAFEPDTFGYVAANGKTAKEAQKNLNKALAEHIVEQLGGAN